MGKYLLGFVDPLGCFAYPELFPSGLVLGWFCLAPINELEERYGCKMQNGGKV